MEKYRIEPTVVIILVIALVIVSTYWVQFGCSLGQSFSPEWTCISSDSERWGQFGDFVGGLLNPILSFCVFFFAYRTYKAQTSQFKKETQSIRFQNFINSTEPVAKKIEQLLTKKSPEGETYGEILEKIFFNYAGMSIVSENGNFSGTHYKNCLSCIGKIDDIEQELIFQIAILKKVAELWDVDDEILATQVCLAAGGSHTIYGLYVSFKYLKGEIGPHNQNVELACDMIISILNKTIYCFENLTLPEVVVHLEDTETNFTKYKNHFYPEMSEHP